MTPFVKRMNELLDVITKAPEQWEREKAKHDMAQLIQRLHGGGRRETSDFKLAQAHDDV